MFQNYSYPSAEIDFSGDSPRSHQYDDVYSSALGAIIEARYVCLELNNLPERFTNRSAFQIGEIGFGIGLNFLLTVEAFLAHASSVGDAHSRLHYSAFEKHPLTPVDHQRAVEQFSELKLFSAELLKSMPTNLVGIHRLFLFDGRVILDLYFGDARELIHDFNGRCDVWFLDGFSPRKNPELWEEDLLFRVVSRTADQGTITTYSVAATVRENLTRAGVEVTKTDGILKKVSCLRATKTAPTIPPRAKARTSNSIAIIGAGLAGIGIAIALKRRGIKTTIFDPNLSRRAHFEETPTTRETEFLQASDNPCSVLMPHVSRRPDNLALWSLHGLLFTRRVFQDFPILGAAYVECGALQCALDGRELQLLSALNNVSVPRDLLCAVSNLEAQEISGIHPNSDLLRAGALFSKFSGVVFTRSLLASAYSSLGLELVASEVKSIEQRSDSVTLVTGSGNVDFDAAVFAGGAAGRSFQWFSELPLQPVRGQLLLKRIASATNISRSVISAEHYLTPPLNGLQVVGSTFERGVFTSEFKSSDELELSEALKGFEKELPPGVNEPGPLSLDSWIGVRAMSPDRLPLVGLGFDSALARREHNPGWREIAYSSRTSRIGMSIGHGSRGLSSAFLAGEHVVCELLETESPLTSDLARAIDPSRFLLRELRSEVR